MSSYEHGTLNNKIQGTLQQSVWRKMFLGKLSVIHLIKKFP